jgi:hypothetical protein
MLSHSLLQQPSELLLNLHLVLLKLLSQLLLFLTNHVHLRLLPYLAHLLLQFSDGSDVIFMLLLHFFHLLLSRPQFFPTFIEFFLNLSQICLSVSFLSSAAERVPEIRMKTSSNFQLEHKRLHRIDKNPKIILVANIDLILLGIQIVQSVVQLATQRQTLNYLGNNLRIIRCF